MANTNFSPSPYRIHIFIYSPSCPFTCLSLPSRTLLSSSTLFPLSWLTSLPPSLPCSLIPSILCPSFMYCQQLLKFAYYLHQSHTALPEEQSVHSMFWGSLGWTALSLAEWVHGTQLSLGLNSLQIPAEEKTCLYAGQVSNSYSTESCASWRTEYTMP